MNDELSHWDYILNDFEGNEEFMEAYENDDYEKMEEIIEKSKQYSQSYLYMIKDSDFR